MSNIITIMRRDLTAYFLSPIGYIFMMVFLTLSVGLYITTFFAFPVADMRPYFEQLPLFLCVFIPAVTMRIWAEERKENTWEMLLTFPMKAWELVLGKFFAALVFFCLTLLGTVTIPMMLMSLGEPDMGVIWSAYFGTLLLGAFMLSLGILFSGFFKDQIVAFAVTLLTLFGFFLLGVQFFAAYLDDHVYDGFGSMLSNLMGFFAHYGPFTRGVIDFADVLYFVAWTVIFIVLNVLYIDGRNRPNAKTIFAGAMAMCIAIGLAFNWLMADFSLVRLDMTQDKIFTVSEASKSILSRPDAPVKVNLYITPEGDMPTAMKTLEQEITDKLEEMRLASGGKLDYSVVHMQVANVIADKQEPGEEEEEEKTEDMAVEKRMLDKGVEPFSVQAMGNDEVTNKLVYSSIGVGYKDKPEEIIPRIIPQVMPELEYKLVSTIYKLTRDKAPKVALVAPKEAMAIDPMVRRMMEQQGMQIPESDDPYIYLEQILQSEKYEVERVELTKESPLPAEYDTLVVVNPRSLNERQRWEIARALHAGKSVVLAVQEYAWDYQPSASGLRISRRDESPQINPLLEQYGLGVSEDVLMDENHVPLTIRGGSDPISQMFGQPVNLPMHILLSSSSMSQDTAITNRLSNVFYLWGTALNIDDAKLKELGLSDNVVMSTTPKAWSVENDTQLTQADFEAPADAARLKEYPLMAVIEGQFPDAFAGQERPAWPKPEDMQQPGFPPQPDEADTDPEPPAEPVEAKPGQLVLMGCSQMFRKEFLQAGNLDLFLNSVDAVTLDENLVHIRGQKMMDRTIDRPSDGQKTFWRFMNYALANVVIAGIGIGLAFFRRQSRNAYTMMQAR
ncbi:MAG: ABC transporter permease subunit [Candidatus Hydrogenedens sp.]|nr:ABC transporter permease subunit [Candidatus Hydrogenedens sp.]